MSMEQQRGISVTTSVMQFPYAGRVVNLLDTPGHEDFSEDTYRTLTAVDSALMVIDAARGVEPRTIKLMEVCRLRDTPIFTFINKLDREIRDPVELMDEIEDVLQIQCAPMTWPIGAGRAFRGVYDLSRDRIIEYERGHGHHLYPYRAIEGLASEQARALLGDDHAAFVDEIELLRGASHAFEPAAFQSGIQTPVFFGTALGNFGVREMLDEFVQHAPMPQSRKADATDGEERDVLPGEPAFTGFVFKIQANMDPKHRDRVAFVRLCSGHFERGMKLHHVRAKKPMAISNPVLFLAAERETAEDAWAGDIIGIPNHGQLRIGDALTEGETLRFTGIPSFAPELLQACRAGDPMKAKHLDKALTQFAEEGAAKLFKPAIGSGWIVGVVGQLQFDVLASRIETEYGLPVRFEQTQWVGARWIGGPKDRLDDFIEANRGQIATDHDGDPVYMTRLQWDIDRVVRDWPELTLSRTKETHS
jgi:peptide chain release factor 3